ncbi:MAG: uroporphyrinogen-III synthase [Ilumatobacteraceae bacterium]
MIDNALVGKRIVITRPANQSLTLIELLRQRGAQPLQMPLIEICAPSDGGVALRHALTELDTFDWVVVTSANGAAAVADELHNCVRRPRIAAIGEATNKALGTIADLVPSSARGDVLAAEFPIGSGRVLLAQAEVTDGVVGATLELRGWNVTEVAAYQTRSVRPEPEVLSRALAADALVLASGSAVRSWVQSAGTRTPPIVVAIGQSTAAVSDSVGIRVTAVAAEPTPTCVLDTLADIFLRRHP